MHFISNHEWIFASVLGLGEGRKTNGLDLDNIMSYSR